MSSDRRTQITRGFFMIGVLVATVSTVLLSRVQALPQWIAVVSGVITFAMFVVVAKLINWALRGEEAKFCKNNSYN